MNKDDETINNNKRRPTAKETSAAATSKPEKRKRSKHRLCKALECQKFRQAKHNGYCVACFQKHGATICRDFNCLNEVHRDGYCVSHLPSVDGTAASKPSKTAKKMKAETKPSKKLEPSKSAANTIASKQSETAKKKKKAVTKPDSLRVDDTIASKQSDTAEKKKKAVTKPDSLRPSRPAKTTQTATKPAKVEPSKPAERAKTKHRYRERFTFPATSTQKALRIDANSRNPNHQTITKNDLQSLFASVLKDSRCAKSSDGKKHYLFDEIREKVSTALESAFESSLSSKPDGRKRPVTNEGGDEAEDEAVTAILGISEEAFTADEVASMPVAFAYHCGDAVSEQNAKIATLDYEVEQGRKKRKTANSSSSQPAKKRKPASPDRSVNFRSRSEVTRFIALHVPKRPKY